MAKTKELSPEERLEAALVPEEEWPYQVPENWCWTYMGSLYEINPKTVSDDNIEAAFIPMGKSQKGTYSVCRWRCCICENISLLRKWKINDTKWTSKWNWWRYYRIDNFATAPRKSSVYILAYQYRGFYQKGMYDVQWNCGTAKDQYGICEKLSCASPPTPRTAPHRCTYRISLLQAR